jgi:hypothetical protein
MAGGGKAPLWGSGVFGRGEGDPAARGGERPLPDDRLRGRAARGQRPAGRDSARPGRQGHQHPGARHRGRADPDDPRGDQAQQAGHVGPVACRNAADLAMCNYLSGSLVNTVIKANAEDCLDSACRRSPRPAARDVQGQHRKGPPLGVDGTGAGLAVDRRGIETKALRSAWRIRPLSSVRPGWCSATTGYCSCATNATSGSCPAESWNRRGSPRLRPPADRGRRRLAGDRRAVARPVAVPHPCKYRRAHRYLRLSPGQRRRGAGGQPRAQEAGLFTADEVLALVMPDGYKASIQAWHAIGTR